MRHGAVQHTASPIDSPIFWQLQRIRVHRATTRASSNLLSSLLSASDGAANASSTTQQQLLKYVLVQFAKMSQNEQSLLSNMQLLANNAVLASQHFQHQQQQQQQPMPQLHSSRLSKSSLPLPHNTAGTLVGANLSAVNTSSNSLLLGILTKLASRHL